MFLAYSLIFLETMEILKEIKKYGLEAIVQKYALLWKPALCNSCFVKCESETKENCLAHKYLLKYHQINSADFKNVQAVRECRGLILSKDLRVMSLAFVRFFNEQEAEADKINWDNARFLKKEDGSCMTLYYDWVLQCWCVQTTGTPDADTNVNNENITFADLFWQVFGTYETGTHLLDENNNYVFELCTKYNQIVAIHEEPKLVLINVKNRNTMVDATYEELVEHGKEIGIPAVECYNLDSLEEVQEMLKDMTKDEEGFVIYDGEKRIKVKNPLYVLAHKSETNFQPKDMFKILQENEQAEFIGVLSRFKEQYYKAEHFWLKLIYEGNKLNSKASEVIKFAENKKDFVFQLAPIVTEWNKLFISNIYRAYDNAQQGRWVDINPEEILREIPYKRLHEIFNKIYKNII